MGSAVSHVNHRRGTSFDDEFSRPPPPQRRAPLAPFQPLPSNLPELNATANRPRDLSRPRLTDRCLVPRHDDHSDDSSSLSPIRRQRDTTVSAVEDDTIEAGTLRLTPRQKASPKAKAPTASALIGLATAASSAHVARGQDPLFPDDGRTRFFDLLMTYLVVMGILFTIYIAYRVHCWLSSTSTSSTSSSSSSSSGPVISQDVGVLTEPFNVVCPTCQVHGKYAGVPPFKQAPVPFRNRFRVPPANAGMDPTVCPQFEREMFNSLTVPVLQEICRSRKLAVSGIKYDIITRIINFNEQQRELGSDVLPTFPQMDLIGQLEREFGCVAPATVWTSRVAASRWISDKITEKKARRQEPPQ